ncbi:hypothetical protein [Parafrankia discariae]|uniref:hypothetical protein n=1 Tax=Parafrankia discariae TaxID=365528 RepID=UPI00035E63F5|nr:hypothetical protein [Parafrankia discariae]
MVGNGAPGARPAMLLGMFRGEFAATGPELENPLKRPATSVRSILVTLTTRS